MQNILCSLSFFDYQIPIFEFNVYLHAFHNTKFSEDCLSETVFTL